VAIIHLGHASPHASSDLPGSSADHASRSPIWSCSGWGLPCRERLPVTRCALTAPFHPYRCLWQRRYVFCCTGRELAPPRRYLAPCPVEPGLSSPHREDAERLPGRLLCALLHIALAPGTQPALSNNKRSTVRSSRLRRSSRPSMRFRKCSRGRKFNTDFLRWSIRPQASFNLA